MTTVRGDLRPGDTVWLAPRTLAAPLICHREPAATLVRFDSPYMVVTVDGAEYRIHEDNVRRSNPHAARRAERLRPKARPRARQGWEEPPLW
jgi:hypothetical protein